MCGITFFMGDHGLRPDAATKLRHRGPDGSAVVVTDAFAMAFDRLAIINAADDGMQPFRTGDRWLICNGEIYNYLDLAGELGVDAAKLRSDVDIVSHLVDPASPASEAASAVARLDGDFAFVLADGETGVFAAARDHVGVRPLFYAVDAEGRVFALASEVKALHGAPGVASVHVFPPGHVYVSSTGDFVAYACHITPLTVPDDGVNRVRRVLERAVEKRLDHSERPVGLLCSGGVDSAIVTCIACTMRDPGLLRVFTIEYDEGFSEDAFYARMLCEKLGVCHTVVRFSRDEVVASIEPVIVQCETYDPNTVRAAIPMYLLAKHIAEQTDVKVVLSGEGADELFAGYNYFRYAAPDEVAPETRRLLGNLRMFDLLRADRCFAAFGLEVRVPYLDQDLVRLVAADAAPVAKRPHEPLAVDDLMPRPRYSHQEKQLLRSSFAHLDVLRDLRILDRGKERFSDGCGFQYVPFLLNHVSDGAPTLTEKLQREKLLYAELFRKHYGTENAHLIVARELPAWEGLPTGDTGNAVAW
jgi:asparagine synthase (glutamine-hydrolysing)